MEDTLVEDAADKRHRYTESLVDLLVVYLRV